MSNQYHGFIDANDNADCKLVLQVEDAVAGTVVVGKPFIQISLADLLAPLEPDGSTGPAPTNLQLRCFWLHFKDATSCNLMKMVIIGTKPEAG